MVESVIQTTTDDPASNSAVVKPMTATMKSKRRKTVVWSVNVFTIVLYMVDPRYMLCQGKWKQVSKRFRKALEIVLRVVVHEASQYIEYSAPLVINLEREYLHSDGFTSLRRIWTMLSKVKVSVGASIDSQFLAEKKFFTILALTVATTSMSDDTAYYDESLPNFDRNTLENILMCKASDLDDMRKLDQLCSKLLSEADWRAEACRKFLIIEQKLIDDEHRMYPEHQLLLIWVLN